MFEDMKRDLQRGLPDLKAALHGDRKEPVHGKAPGAVAPGQRLVRADEHSSVGPQQKPAKDGDCPACKRPL